MKVLVKKISFVFGEKVSEVPCYCSCIFRTWYLKVSMFLVSFVRLVLFLVPVVLFVCFLRVLGSSREFSCVLFGGTMFHFLIL